MAKKTAIAFLKLGFPFLMSTSLSHAHSITNPDQIKSLNETLGLRSSSQKLFIYGIINLNCPCSQSSFQSFEEMATALRPNAQLIVLDVGATSISSFMKFKKALRPHFDLRYDPKKKSVETFNARVTPSAYIVKDLAVIYQSAVIDPSKDPSPHYLSEALKLVLAGKVAPSTDGFGCMIEN